ncbi:Telomeric repeat-binding factor 1 [Bienertia sinuspersici]
MDEKIAKWIIEFLLRKPIDEKIINGVLSFLPLCNNDNRFKKTILLRAVQSEVSNGSVSEKLLDLLEVIEELDHREGKVASNLMKEAYCLVAVDCTVRFLEENVEENGKYVEAVERVWRDRVCLMDSMASEELNLWLRDIEAAVWDSGVCEKIWMRNTRNEALKAAKSYLKEAWESMGPAFLELVAKKVGNEVEECRRGKDGGGREVSLENPCRELVVSQGTRNTQSCLRRKHVAMKSRRPKGAKISDAEKEEDAQEPVNEASDVPAQQSEKVQETLQSDSMQQFAAVNDIHLDASQTARDLSPTKMKDNTTDVNAVENKTGPEIHATAEVNRVQYALRTSSRELHAVVTDPLIEAFKMVETMTPVGVTGNHDNTAGNQTRPKMHAIPKADSGPQVPESSSVKHADDRNLNHDAHEKVENVSSKMATNNMSNDPKSGGQIQPEVDVPRESTDINMENIEKEGELKENAQGNGFCNPKEQLKRKRGLMEPNDTSHTLEWDESVENSSRGLRGSPRLPPSPNRSTASPLRPYEDKKFRRERRRWTAQEEDTLKEAVKKFGHRWTMIRTCYEEVFNGRTDGDLKDKWRNMVKSQR